MESGAKDAVSEGRRQAVLLLPGIVLPADLAYAGLLDALGSRYDAAAKELDVYAGDAPPPGYAVGDEVEGVIRFADAAGWERFHLVGYSAGGAIAIATAARHPDRLLSLAVIEPAWAGHWSLTPEERELWREFERIEASAGSERELLAGFVRIQLAPGVEPPPPEPGPPPPWMAKRPAGIRAIGAAFRDGEIERDALEAFDRPVYFARGGLSSDYWRMMEERLRGAFPRFHSEVFEQRHHFDPVHRAEPERLAAALRSHWSRAAD